MFPARGARGQCCPGAWGDTGSDVPLAHDGAARAGGAARGSRGTTRFCVCHRSAQGRSGGFDGAERSSVEDGARQDSLTVALAVGVLTGSDR